MFSSHRLAEALITSQRPRVSALSDVAHRDARAPRPAPTHPTARSGTYLDVQLARDDGRANFFYFLLLKRSKDALALGLTESVRPTVVRP